MLTHILKKIFNSKNLIPALIAGIPISIGIQTLFQSPPPVPAPQIDPEPLPAPEENIEIPPPPASQPEGEKEEKEKKPAAPNARKIAVMGDRSR